MIENLKNINDRNLKLAKFTEKDLDNLYLRVFQGADGELVLQDLANRAFVYETNVLGIEPFNSHREGMRALWLSIQSRLQGAVQIKTED
jgi:hypothetical protein